MCIYNMVNIYTNPSENRAVSKWKIHSRLVYKFDGKQFKTPVHSEILSP